MRILIFGDSITWGFADSEKSGWVQRLRQQYDKESSGEIEVYNLGISGETTDGLTKRLAIEIGARRWFDDPFIIVIQIGINDTLIRDGKPASTTELYHGGLQQILSSARQYSDHILFVGLSPVDDESATFSEPSATVSYQNERILEFEKVLRDFCTENELPLVEIYEAFQGKRIEENLLADGLHPNEAGHQLIAEAVKPKLDDLIKA